MCICIFLFGETEGQETFKESEPDQGKGENIKSEDQASQQMHIPDSGTALENKKEETSPDKSDSMQTDNEIGNESDNMVKEICERIIENNTTEIAEFYGLKMQQEQNFKEALLKELHKSVDKKNITKVQTEKELNRATLEILQIEFEIDKIQNETIKLNSLAELKKLEILYQSSDNADLQNIDKILTDKTQKLKKLEIQFSEKYDATKNKVINALLDINAKIQEGSEFRNMTIKQKARSIKYINKIIDTVSNDDNVEGMGWYRYKGIKIISKIATNRDIDVLNLKSLPFKAKAVSSSSYNKTYNAMLAVDQNIRTGWVSNSNKGYLSISYDEVEKPVKKIFFVMRRYYVDDPIYKAKITINRDIKITTGRINNNETLVTEFNKPIIPRNIIFAIEEGKNHPGIYEIILSSE